MNVTISGTDGLVWLDCPCGYHVRNWASELEKQIQKHLEICPGPLSEGESVKEERTETVAFSPSENGIKTNDLITSSSGTVRDSTEGKIDYLLIRDGPMYRRWAEHLSNAVPTRGKRNWMNARTPEDLERFRESFARHAEQYLDGDYLEDHMAAVYFNGNGAEYVRRRLLTEPD